MKQGTCNPEHLLNVTVNKKPLGFKTEPFGLITHAQSRTPDLISVTLHSDWLSQLYTWIQNSSFSEHHLHVFGFNLLLKNRAALVSMGVSRSISTIPSNSRLLLTCITPSSRCCGRTPDLRGSLGASDVAMLDYLASSLIAIEGHYPGCRILLTGDFNRLNVTRLLAQFKLRQLVRVPTRGERTLDLIITNTPQLYDKDFVQTFPPFGLLDHSVVLLRPKPRTVRTSSCRTITRRDTRPSRRYLGSADWSMLDSVQGCENKLQLFFDLVKIA